MSAWQQDRLAYWLKKKPKLHGLSPRANYTDRAGLLTVGRKLTSTSTLSSFCIVTRGFQSDVKCGSIVLGCSLMSHLYSNGLRDLGFLLLQRFILYFPGLGQCLLWYRCFGGGFYFQLHGGGCSEIQWFVYSTFRSLFCVPFASSNMCNPSLNSSQEARKLFLHLACSVWNRIISETVFVNLLNQQDWLITKLRVVQFIETVLNQLKMCVRVFTFCAPSLQIAS
jgi:hypothetical protein